jgi:hypothetical protein
VSRPAIERFLDRVEREGDCLVWTGVRNQWGYGRFYVTGYRLVAAHRWAYEYFVGPVPLGLHIDHLCRNRACVNVMHLEAVTQRENTLRGNGHAAIAVRTETCKRGHVGQFFVRPSGRRRCRTCYVEEYQSRPSRAVSA